MKTQKQNTNTFTIQKWFIAVSLLITSIAAIGQEKQKLTILHMDVNGLEITPEEAGNLVRLEMEKLDTFEITDRYDVTYLVKKKNLNVEECYGKLCLVDLGKELNSDLMLSGTIEKITKTIIVSFRLIDVKQNKILTSHVQEYLPIPEELQTMVNVSLRRLLAIPVSEKVEGDLSKVGSYESALNNPNVDRLNLSGPRSGFSYVTGENGRVLTMSEQDGGYNTYPMLYMFGYQFEVQYLNQGNYQALFEIVPAITGFTNNIFRPSLNVLNGFRNNKNGWEIAFGPTFGVTKMELGYYNNQGQWIRRSEVTPEDRQGIDFRERVGSRGTPEFTSNLLFAVGKTFKSGKVNMPVNMFFIPSKQGSTIGLTVGFNSKRGK